MKHIIVPQTYDCISSVPNLHPGLIVKIYFNQRLLYIIDKHQTKQFVKCNLIATKFCKGLQVCQTDGV